MVGGERRVSIPRIYLFCHSFLHIFIPIPHLLPLLPLPPSPYPFHPSLLLSSPPPWNFVFCAFSASVLSLLVLLLLLLLLLSSTSSLSFSSLLSIALPSIWNLVFCTCTVSTSVLCIVAVPPPFETSFYVRSLLLSSLSSYGRPLELRFLYGICFCPLLSPYFPPSPLGSLTQLNPNSTQLKPIQASSTPFKPMQPIFSKTRLNLF